MTDFPSLQKSLPRKRPQKSPANSNCFSFSFRFGVTGVLTIVSYTYMCRISWLVSCSILSTKVCLLALILLYFRGASYNPVSSRNKTKYIKAIAAHPLPCYRFSMTSTSSKAGIKRQTNHFAFERNHLASIVFEPNVDAW